MSSHTGPGPLQLPTQVPGDGQAPARPPRRGQSEALGRMGCVAGSPPVARCRATPSPLPTVRANSQRRGPSVCPSVCLSTGLRVLAVDVLSVPSICHPVSSVAPVPRHTLHARPRGWPSAEAGDRLAWLDARNTAAGSGRRMRAGSATGRPPPQLQSSSPTPLAPLAPPHPCPSSQQCPYRK